MDDNKKQEALEKGTQVKHDNGSNSTMRKKTQRVMLTVPEKDFDPDPSTHGHDGYDLWDLIKDRTSSFKDYSGSMEGLDNRFTKYQDLKNQTEEFVRGNLKNNIKSPYLNSIWEKLDPGLRKLNDPIEVYWIELIWSYWQEEGLLIQTMNAISRRFQNIRIGIDSGLNHLDIDPLRPLHNILWGYIQDTQHRLNIQRRTYEYNHHYGLTLLGKAIKPLHPVDSRGAFIGALNNLLNKCALFFREQDDTTRIADGFPILNCLKEVHLLLAEGAHNQFGELPLVARTEMLIEQWILSRPEMRDFLGGRIMTPYDEPWMDKVDTVKNLMGWDKISVKYYHDLARFGEQILLSIRFTNWNSIDDSAFSAAWANSFRNEIQAYIHRYMVVTGVDLSADALGSTKKSFNIIPSVLIKRRLDFAS